ncbi:MAG: septum formation initiator family protein [Bacteroidales bacterium]|nr:septum formation initiator family protein [Candidatus Equibacterium intestinale]
MVFFTKIKERTDAVKGKSLIARILLNKYFIATMVFLLLIVFNGHNSLTQMIRCMTTLRDQQKQEIHYKEAIRSTDEQIRQLTSNKDTLERFARENYYFQEDGEDVYIVEHNNQK